MNKSPKVDPADLATKELCFQYLAEEVFRFRPKDYQKRYPKWPGQVGLEIEMLPLLKGPHGLETIPIQGPDGIGTTIRKLAARDFPKWQPEYIGGDEESGLLRILTDQGDQLTFEPGGQVEFSSKPYPCLFDAVRRVQKVQGWLYESLAPRDILLFQLGINPWHSVDHIGLQMVKPRYRAMNEYFASIGPYGRRMMRQTCSIQVNLDFGANEQTLAKRYLLANLLSPIATAIFANSPVTEGKDTGHRNFRSKVWQNLDPSRTGFPDLSGVAEKLNLKSSLESYLDYSLNSRVVYVEALGFEIPDRELTFGRWLEEPYKGVSPTVEDYVNHLSLLFPEVRPRNFLEIRSIDCLSRVWQFTPAMFFTALLYNDEALDKSLELLLPWLPELPKYLELASYGLKDDLIFKKSCQIIQHVLGGFDQLPDCFQGEGSREQLHRFMEWFPLARKTPADEIVGALAGGDGEIGLFRLEESWQEGLSH